MSQIRQPLSALGGLARFAIDSRRQSHPAPIHVQAPAAMLQHVRRHGALQRLAGKRDRLKCWF
jgi:hypothetical protein